MIVVVVVVVIVSIIRHFICPANHFWVSLSEERKMFAVKRKIVLFHLHLHHRISSLMILSSSLKMNCMRKGAEEEGAKEGRSRDKEEKRS